MNPILKMLQAARGANIPRSLRSRAFKDIRGAGKGFSKGNLNMSQMAEDELDKILVLMNTNRYDNPYVDDLLDEVIKMYKRGGGR